MTTSSPPEGEVRVPAALLPAVGQHGTVCAFDSSQEEWSEYAETSTLFCSERDCGRGEETSDFTLRHRTKHVQTSQDIGVSQEAGRTLVCGASGSGCKRKPSPIVKRSKLPVSEGRRVHSDVYSRAEEDSGALQIRCRTQ